MNAEDLSIILQDIRHIAARYKDRKNFLSALDVQDMRDDLAVLNVQLGDYAAEHLLHDRLDTEAKRRSTQLEIRSRAEEEFRKNKVSYAVDKARYKSEEETQELVREENLAKRIYTHAETMYRHTLPKLLDAMSSRIAILVRHNLEATTKSGEDVGHEEQSEDRFSLFQDELAGRAEADAAYLQEVTDEEDSPE